MGGCCVPEGGRGGGKRHPRWCMCSLPVVMLRTDHAAGPVNLCTHVYQPTSVSCGVPSPASFSPSSRVRRRSARTHAFPCARLDQTDRHFIEVVFNACLDVTVAGSSIRLQDNIDHSPRRERRVVIICY